MGWDSSRPVPWERLVREWLIYAAIMAVIFVVFFRDGNLVGALAGVLVSGPLYLLFGAVLAKFGYQRKRLKDLRAERESARASGTTDDRRDESGPRRPPPTRRTSTGPNRPTSKQKRRR